MSRARPRGKPATTGIFSAFEQAAGAAALQCKRGKQAVANHCQDQVRAKLASTKFTASVDLDTAFAQAEPNAHRWDYGLGLRLHGGTEFAVWVEPHPAASTREVKVVLAKLDWLQAKLRQPEFSALQDLTEACAHQGWPRFHWLATGRVTLRPGSREARMLAQRGMKLPASRVVIG